jgi:lipopolysaccharide cholinephosphotransferase
MIKKIVRVFGAYGIVGGLRYAVKKATGRAALEESVDSLYYYLNRYCDIGAFPKAEGRLRALQLCDAELLRVFDAVCEKHGLCYWLDFGTLLGARRHSGFIPWDDDLDVSMPREDFDRAFSVLPEEMKRFGIEVKPFPNCPMGVFGFSFRHLETGIWLDVFPVDPYYTDGSLEEVRETLLKGVRQYRKYYDRHKLKMSRADMTAAKERFFLAGHAKPSDGRTMILINDPEFDPPRALHDGKDVFPLSRIQFEGYGFNGPKDADEYLKAMYGPDFMCFPKRGIEHHGDDDNKLKDRAARHGLDMNEVAEELRRLLEAYKNA